VKPIALIGIVLTVLGVLALAYQGINYSRQKDILDVGSVHISTETHERIGIPAALGAAVLAGGVALIFVGAKAKA
jgi:hypothetical protein